MPDGSGNGRVERALARVVVSLVPGIDIPVDPLGGTVSINPARIPPIRGRAVPPVKSRLQLGEDLGAGTVSHLAKVVGLGFLHGNRERHDEDQAQDRRPASVCDSRDLFKHRPSVLGERVNTPGHAIAVAARTPLAAGESCGRLAALAEARPLASGEPHRPHCLALTPTLAPRRRRGVRRPGRFRSPWLWDGRRIGHRPSS